MADYQNEYQKKLISAKEAASFVKSGMWVDYGWSMGHPKAIDKALAERSQDLYDVKVRGGNTMEVPAIFEVDDAASHFTFNSTHCSGIDRKYMASGLVYYNPIRFSELPSYYENMEENDIAFIRVCPMDKHGNFNLGPNTAHLYQVIKHSKKIIVEVNENMPHCLGGYGTEIHISKVDGIVESDNEPMPTLGSAEPSENDVKMAEFIFDDLVDGACLQLGIGKTPNAVGSMIAKSDLKDLGVHTEMYVDAFMELSKAGKITGTKKKIAPGRQVYAFAAGSKELYDFLDDNPSCLAAPVDYVNDIGTISSIDNFMSINSAINVDLFGQVAAETAGTRHISGAGGQMDFVLGAYLSEGGKSFICVSSSRAGKDGKKSTNIVPTLSEGSIVTTLRSSVQYLVTENGKVNLKGMSTWERAEKIISIADPDFQDDLIKQAQNLGIWRKSNKK